MKEEYIKNRNSNKFTINFFYKYYLENGGIPVDMQMFKSLFSLRDINDVLQNIDRKFELTRLHDRDDKFIKIIE